MRTETLLWNKRTVGSVKDGRSFMLTSIKESQRKESLMRSSVSMSKEISMLFLRCHLTDTLTLSTTETW